MEPSKPTTDPSYFWQTAANMTTIVLIALLLLTVSAAWPDWYARVFEPAKEIALAIAGCFVARAAWLGVDTWRMQLRGTARFETCRDLLQAVLKAESRLVAARKLSGMTPDQLRQVRRDYINEAQDALIAGEPSLLAAEAVVDVNLANLVRRFAALLIEYRECTRRPLPHSEETMQVLDWYRDGQTNAFTQRVNTLVGQIRSACRHHLEGRAAR